MKKRLLSLALVLSLCLSMFPLSSLAVEPFVPIYEWSAADWKAAESWTDGQWISYFEWEEATVQTGDYYDSLWRAQDNWTDAQWDLYYKGSSIYDKYRWEESKKQEMAALGFPYSDGINVKVNDKFIPFAATDRPYIADGNTMVPLRAFVEYLGGSVSYDAAPGRPSPPGTAPPSPAKWVTSSLLSIGAAKRNWCPCTPPLS